MRCAFLTFVLAIIPTIVWADDKHITWEKWSDQVVDRARKENRFILLDLEAVWCHWCHVMDEKTYSDPKVIDLINSHYIAIRVDQDSRPDLSNKYSEWGWPATIVFHPSGQELVKRRGFIPPEGMRSMLQAVIDDPTPGPSVQAENPPAVAGGVLTPQQLEQIRRRFDETYDAQVGGWGGVHRFLDADNIEYAILHDSAKAKQTLAAARKLIDPVWGGLYQYSTDSDWDHPHFERIMSFQSDALRMYSLAYARWGDEADLAAAKNVARFLQAFLKSPDGAFYTSMDADVVPGEHSGEYFKLDDASRRKRGIPRVDKHVYSRENGWAIIGLSALYCATGDEASLADAKKAAEWIINRRHLSDGGFRHDEADVAGPYFNDTLAMGRAFLSLYRATGERAWLDRADAAGKYIEEKFLGKLGVFTAPPSIKRGFSPNCDYDENIAAARFGNLLFQYTGYAGHRALAETAMSCLASDIDVRRSAVGGLLLSADELSRDPTHVTIVGSKSDPTAIALFVAANRAPFNYIRLDWYDLAEGPLARSDVEFPTLKTPAAFFCDRGACSSPVSSPATLKKLLRSP